MSKVSSNPAPATFQTTRWTLISAAGQDASPQAAEALDQLCRAYWKPVCAHISRRLRSDATAEDLTQDFFVRMLGKDYFRRADSQRGRFRTFLLTALDHFLINDWHHRQTERRGGGAEAVPLGEDGVDERIADPANSAVQAGVLFDRDWAAAVLELTLLDLRAEYSADGKAELFDQLKAFVGAGSSPPPAHEVVAAERGLSPGAVRVAVHRLRDRYRELLRGRIADTVTTPGDVDDELRHLINVIRAT